MAEERAKIPARYTGSTVTLKGGPYYHADGTRRETNVLNPGDIILVNPEEVLGVSYFRDESDQLWRLGVGKLVKPEHAELDPRELGALGYEFHEGRPDFESVEPEPGEEVPSRPVQQSAPVVAQPVSDVALDVTDIPGVEIIPDPEPAPSSPVHLGG